MIGPSPIFVKQIILFFPLFFLMMKMCIVSALFWKVGRSDAAPFRNPEFSPNFTFARFLHKDRIRPFDNRDIVPPPILTT
jgi:hypothetical protein